MGIRITRLEESQAASSARWLESTSSVAYTQGMTMEEIKKILAGLHRVQRHEVREYLDELDAANPAVDGTKESSEAPADAPLDVERIEAVAQEVLDLLEGLTIEDCWDRAGPRRDGYTDLVEAANEMVEETLELTHEAIKRLAEEGNWAEERNLVAGLVWGARRYAKETRNDFRDYGAEAAPEYAAYVLDLWLERNRQPERVAELKRFLAERCPD